MTRAAGVGVTRLPLSSRNLRMQGVTFVPLATSEPGSSSSPAQGRAIPRCTRFARSSTTCTRRTNNARKGWR
jgi:hypothetical protein